jgi:hypothetical protein
LFKTGSKSSEICQVDRKEWNRRLVDAIFRARVDSSPEIRRIDATDGFLADVGGFNDREAARASFLDSMPHRDDQVRSLFDEWVLWDWAPSSDSLPFYAQLHLTVLAASADESLHDEGNFRVRFAEMLGLNPRTDYVSSRLPRLWECASDWSEYWAEQGVVRRLILPDPKGQVIIGYSKRLAFPEIRDQNRLAQVLTEAGVDASSPLRRLRAALRSTLNRFSGRFRREFELFESALDRGDRSGAEGTAFWEALVETTWTRTRESQKAAVAGCRLELDPTDPYDVGLWLQCPREGPVGSGWTIAREDRWAAGNVVWRRSDDCSPGVSLDLLRTSCLATEIRTLVGDRLARALATGCLGFAQDDDGRWFEVPALPDSGFVWLVVHRCNSGLLDAPKGRSGGPTVHRAPLAGAGSWVLFGPLDCNDSTRSWFETHSVDLDLFAERLVRRRVVVEGTVQTADGTYLALPPMEPSFRCEGARFGSIVDEGADSHGDARELDLRDERFQMPSNFPRHLPSSLRVDVRDGNGRRIATQRIRLVDSSGALSFENVRRPEAWLESGLGGRLSAFLTDPLGDCDVDQHQERLSDDCNRSRPLSKTDLPGPNSRIAGLPNIDDRWWRTIEILSAIFLRRQAYPVGDCAELLERIWGSRDEAWSRLEDLLQNGVLRSLHSRHWWGRSVVAGQPVIVIQTRGSEISVRIVGLLSEAMRASVERETGMPCRVVTSPGCDVVGALVCPPVERDALDRLIRETGWPCLDWDDLPKVAIPRFESLLATDARADLNGYREEDKTVWSESLGAFVEVVYSGRVLPRLERWRAHGQQDLYVLHRTDGARWNTDCGAWARLTLAAVGDRGIGQVSRDGSIRLFDAGLSLPRQLAWRNVAGGGLSFRPSDGGRVYSGGESWSPSEACVGWVEDLAGRGKSSSRRPSARQRYEPIAFGTIFAYATLSA